MFPLKIGDVVATTGGSPNMTIEEVTEDGKFVCGWFVRGYKKTASFYPDVLTVVYQEPTIQDMINHDKNR